MSFFFLIEQPHRLEERNSVINTGDSNILQTLEVVASVSYMILSGILGHGDNEQISEFR